MTKANRKKTEKSVNIALDLLASISGFPSNEACNMPAQELVTKTRDYRKSMMMSWIDDEVYLMTTALHALVPLLRDEMEMVGNEAMSRKKNAELYSE